MFNAVSKSFLTLLVGGSVAMSLSVSSCSSESESARASRILCEEAEALNLAGKPEEGLLLLDSLQRAYPSETDWQRTAMKLRPTLMISATENQINAVNDTISQLEQEYNILLPRMKRVSDPRLVEPYYVAAATYKPDFMKSTGIQPRVSDIGQFYVISSVNGGGLKHTGFTVTCQGETVQVGPVPYDGEMNYRINGGEIVTYSPEQCEALGRLASAHSDSPMTLTLTGAKNKTIKLSAKEVNAIANCYDFSRTIVDARQLAFERERLNRQLDIARSQAERLSQPE